MTVGMGVSDKNPTVELNKGVQMPSQGNTKIAFPVNHLQMP